MQALNDMKQTNVAWDCGTRGIGVLVLVVGVVPPAVVFRLFGGRETQTVAEMLRQ